MNQAHSLLITVCLFAVGAWLIARGDTPHGLLLIVAALPNAQQIMGGLAAPKPTTPTTSNEIQTKGTP